MSYQANIDITVGTRKYCQGDVIDKISDASVRWLLRDAYIIELPKEKADGKDTEEETGKEATDAFANAEEKPKPPKRKSGAKSQTKAQQKADSGKDAYV